MSVKIKTEAGRQGHQQRGQADEETLEEGVCRALRRDLLTGAVHAAEDTWPAQPITCMEPFTPGGITENTARVLAKILGSKLSHPVFVDSRPGAGG